MSKRFRQRENRRFTNVQVRTATVADMAQYLAAMLNMDPAQHSLMQQLLVLISEFRRDADDSVDYLLRSRGLVARPWYMSLDYAAGVVAAAVRHSTGARTATAARLACLLGASPELIKCIRDALLAEFATTVPPRLQPFSLDELVSSRAREETAATLLRRSREQPPPPREPNDNLVNE